MGMIPFENNPYVSYGNSLNELTIDIINPLGYWANFAVQVIGPLFPMATPEVEEAPEFLLSDFLIWARPLRDYLNDEDTSFYPLYQVLHALAIEKVRWANIGNAIIYKRLIALFIAHYFTMAIKMWKDETNDLSLNPTDSEKKQTYVLTVGATNIEDFDSTIYGKQFWHEYKEYGRYADGIWGVNWR